MKKILVFGSTSYIAKALMNSIGKKYHVIAVGKKRPDSIIRNNFYTYSNYLELSNLVHKFDPDLSLILTGYRALKDTPSELNKMIEANHNQPLILIDILSQKSNKKVIYSGSYHQNVCNRSGYCFNKYVLTKNILIESTKYYVSRNKIQFINLKLPDVYGPNDKRKTIINSLIQATKTHCKIKVSKGEQYMDCLYISDTVLAFEMVIEDIFNKDNINFQEFTISSRNQMQLRKVIEIFQDFGLSSENIEIGGINYRENELFHELLTDDYLTNFYPKINIRDGIKKCLETQIGLK